MSDYKKIKTEYANKTKNRKKTKNVLIGGIVLLCISLFLFIITFINIYDYSDKLTYEETTSKSYTFNEIKPRRGSWLVYVEEENNPLLIYNIVMDSELQDDLLELKKGTKIFCRVIDANNGLMSNGNSYEIVEIKTSKNLLTLTKYNEMTKNNAIIGIIACPIVSAIFLFIAFICFKYR